MTPAEWLACDNPETMLNFLRDKASARKIRLFGAACCRRVWPQLASVASRRAVEFAEDYADGKRTRKELITAGSAALAPLNRVLDRGGWADSAAKVSAAARATAYAGEWAAEHASRIARLLLGPAEALVQCNLMRDIFDPFHSLIAKPEWLTPTSCPSHKPPTTSASSPRENWTPTGSQFWRMPLRRPAPARSFWGTYAARGRTSAVAPRLICCWGRPEREGEP
jgi:hypothetical protein